MLARLLLVLAFAAVAALGASQVGTFDVPEYSTFLLRYDSVQKELGISSPAARKIAKIRLDAQRKYMASLQPSANRPNEVRQPSLADVKKQMELVDKAVLALLTARQKARLKEIGIQYAGPFGLVDARISKIVKVTKDQQRKIYRVGLDAIQAYNVAASSSASPKGNGYRNRAPNPQLMLRELGQKRMKMLADFTAQVAKILTPSQAATWKALQGKKFPIQTLMVPPNLR